LLGSPTHAVAGEAAAVHNSGAACSGDVTPGGSSIILMLRK
jgi:hypothetical protein